jgi:hypothetical protein
MVVYPLQLIYFLPPYRVYVFEYGVHAFHSGIESVIGPR